MPVDGGIPYSSTRVEYTRLIYCEPWSEWCTHPSVPPWARAHAMACSGACSGSSPVRIVEATAQPTILLAYASVTNAAYANEPSASRT